MREQIVHLDYRISKFFQSTVFPGLLDQYMRGASRIGDYGVVWFVIAGVLMMIPSYRISGLSLMIGIVMTIVLGEGVLKFTIRRLRPFLVHDDITAAISPPRSFSFPSGHTAMSWRATVFLGQELIGSHTSLLLACLLLSFSISFSRIYLRVHYFSDVIAGVIFGVAMGILTEYIPHTAIFTHLF